ncbi:hypothetical protein AGMMS50268_29480 [Spirochaetia bacterium]|nr:hypothetical protein AGMMS50268_29480 [Spirochaetia bacterium]
MQLDQVPVFEQIQAKSDNRAMEEYSADDFWKRYDMITGGKDNPIIVKTGLKQPTLSTWKAREIYPRADMATKIANSLNTSVEYLVTGKEKIYSSHTPAALEIARASDKLNEDGKRIVLDVAKGLETRYPLENSASINRVNS